MRSCGAALDFQAKPPMSIEALTHAFRLLAQALTGAFLEPPNAQVLDHHCATAAVSLPLHPAGSRPDSPAPALPGRFRRQLRWRPIAMPDRATPAGARRHRADGRPQPLTRCSANCSSPRSPCWACRPSRRAGHGRLQDVADPALASDFLHPIACAQFHRRLHPNRLKTRIGKAHARAPQMSTRLGLKVHPASRGGMRLAGCPHAWRSLRVYGR